MVARLIVILAIFMLPNLCWAEDLLGRVVIDPGHGGYDPGATRKGVSEKQINLEISKEIIKCLKKNKVEVMLTRDGDYNHAIPGLHKKEAKRYDFDKRVELAKNFGADAMISIHVNAARRKCSGPEAFYFKKSVQGKLLAECIQKELHQIPETRQRTIKTGSYYLLTHTNMPCVIVETGFINNPEEREKLLEEKYRQELAKAIAKGIVEYLNVKDDATKEDKKVFDSLRTFFTDLQKKGS